nr:MAG TPA: hypothetical protein [Caudoviricetes sp.]
MQNITLPRVFCTRPTRAAPRVKMYSELTGNRKSCRIKSRQGNKLS